MATRHEFTLDNGTKFYIRRYDVFLALKILGDVQKKFLAPIALFMEASGNTVSPEIRDKTLQDALDKISKSLDGESIVDLAKKVLNAEFVSVSVDGQPPQKLDEGTLNLATDSIFDVVSLIFEVLRVNYEELFTRGKTLIGTVQLPTATIQ